jgi:hypothetical protein
VVGRVGARSGVSTVESLGGVMVVREIEAPAGDAEGLALRRSERYRALRRACRDRLGVREWGGVVWLVVLGW